MEDSYTKFEETQKRYWNSPAGKATKQRYTQSELGRENQRRYFESEKGKEALLRYYLSEKAETTRQKRQALLKLFRQLDKYLRKYPDKTTEDFFNR